MCPLKTLNANLHQNQACVVSTSTCQCKLSYADSKTLSRKRHEGSIIKWAITRSEVTMFLLSDSNTSEFEIPTFYLQEIAAAHMEKAAVPIHSSQYLSWWTLNP